jgi:MFS family permease
MILPLIGGVLMFKFGYRPMYIIFGCFIFLGQLVVSIGCSANSSIVMIIGRIIYGIGGETINVAQLAVVIEWFTPKEVGLAIGLCFSTAKLGSILNDILTPLIIAVRNIFT